MLLSSTSFLRDGEIPAMYTCEGEDVSPALSWSDAPAGTKSFALVVEDPDAPDPAAPKRVFVHWVLYNLPADAMSLPEGVTREQLPRGTLLGQNDWQKTGYNGPCPPIGRHRYFHRLFALDVVLPDLRLPSKNALVAAMEGHVLAKAELVGTYQKRKKATVERKGPAERSA